MMAKNRQRKKELGVRTSVVLPPEVLKKLRQSERGPSAEIRERIARTLEEEVLDRATRELREIVGDLAWQLGVDCERPWHQSQQTYRSFRAALKDALDAFEPGAAPDEPALPGNMHPETLGRMRVRDMRRSGRFPCMEAASKRRPTRTPFREEEPPPLPRFEPPRPRLQEEDGK
jgi:hypothetical protein